MKADEELPTLKRKSQVKRSNKLYLVICRIMEVGDTKEPRMTQVSALDKQSNVGTIHKERDARRYEGKDEKVTCRPQSLNLRLTSVWSSGGFYLVLK